MCVAALCSLFDHLNFHRLRAHWALAGSLPPEVPSYLLLGTMALELGLTKDYRILHRAKGYLLDLIKTDAELRGYTKEFQHLLYPYSFPDSRKPSQLMVRLRSQGYPSFY
jgi:hypothetical protein